MFFKNFHTNEKIEDYLGHIKEFVEKYPTAKIAVGSDSKYRKGSKRATFVTVIAMFYPGTNGFNKGAHLIYSMKRERRDISLFERLWEEVEISKIIAEEIQDSIQFPVEIHIDVNPKKDFKSNVAYQPAIGMLNSLGFDVYAKPHAPAATCAADLIVNKK